MLDPVKLEEGIFNLMVELAKNIDEDQDPKVGMRKYAKGMAKLIDDYTRNAVVSTTGTAAAQTGKLS